MDENRAKLIEKFKEKHAAYKDFLDTKSWQFVLEDLENEYHVNRSSIRSMSSIDPIVVACAEAQRMVVLRIRNLANGDQLKNLEPENKQQ